MNVIDLEKYWESLSNNIEFYFGVLSSKKEYGTGELCSEAGIQRSLLYYAENIGRKYNVNVCKVKGICVSIGLCFPQYGSVGFLAIKELINAKNIKLTLNDICLYSIEKYLYDNGQVITPALDDALHAYYENYTDDIEVNIVRACQMKAKEIRELMKRGVAAGKAIDAVMKPFEKTFDPTKEIIMYSESDSVNVPIEIQNEVNDAINQIYLFNSKYEKDSDIVDAIAEFIL